MVSPLGTCGCFSRSHSLTRGGATPRNLARAAFIPVAREATRSRRRRLSNELGFHAATITGFSKLVNRFIFTENDLSALCGIIRLENGRNLAAVEVGGEPLQGEE